MRRCVTVGIRAATPAAGRSGSGPPPSSRLLPWLWQLLLSIGVRRLGGTVGRRRHRSPVSGSHTGGTPVAVVRHPRCPTRRCRRHRRSLPLSSRVLSGGGPLGVRLQPVEAVDSCDTRFSVLARLPRVADHLVLQRRGADREVRHPQAKLLRVLQDGEYRRLGENRTPAPRPAGPPRHAPAPR